MLWSEEKYGVIRKDISFLKNYINPAIESGFVKVLYPEKLNHPRQRYLLTVKGDALLSSLNKRGKL